MITWELMSFSELPRETLYEILALRQKVFVVEQKCAYLDVDGRDQHSHHLTGRNDQGELVAYLRIVEPGYRFPEPCMGRVVVDLTLRGQGWGVQLMKEGLRYAKDLYPDQPIRISAQEYLRRFYEGLGFVCLGEGNPYDEDGIPHLDMMYHVSDNDISRGF